MASDTPAGQPATLPAAAVQAMCEAARARCKCGPYYHDYDCTLQLDEDAARALLEAAAPHLALPHPIAMSLHFEDVDPVATCLVPGCGWHAHGDAVRDATNAWLGHVTSKHREDWDRP